MLIGINALAFVLSVADPVIRGDDWYFLDLIARPAFNGTLSLGNFFAHRGNLDHTLLLIKLAFLGELKWFHLDCRPEAIIGVLCAFASVLALWSIFSSKPPVEPRNDIRSLGWVTATALLLSMNSTLVWTWPPLTLDYCSVTLATLVFLLCAWRGLERGRVGLLAAMAVPYAMIADHTAMMTAFALFVLLAVLWARQLMRERLARVALAGVAVVAITQLTIRWLAPTLGESQRSAILQPVWREFLAGRWWKWIVLPLSNSIVDLQHLAGLGQGSRLSWQVSIAVGLMVAHIWFWRHFMTAPVDKATFSAAFLMLYFYGLVASIVLGRVSMFGSEYVNQPRYVFFYQLNLIALIIMAVASYRSRKDVLPRSIAAGVASVVLLLQLTWAWAAWYSAPWIHRYQVRMAEQILAMGSNPSVAPPDCAPELPPCRYSVDRRRAAIGFLYKHRLNVYSREFRLAHGFPTATSPSANRAQAPSPP